MFSSRCLLVLLAAVSTIVAAEQPHIVLQSTTSTQNSGLLDVLVHEFKAAHDIEVRVVAVGTGQALRNARNGDGDVLLVHARSAEERFVEEGYGIERFDVMYNDFVIVGPADDPARVGASKDVVSALQRIARAQKAFASRGDDSGTHKKEMSLWSETSFDLNAASGTWYRETGSGMGATLNIGVAMNAYVLTDRATWISFANKQNFKIIFEGDPRLFNQYGVILVNPAKHPNVRAKLAQKFIDWLLGTPGQTVIGNYAIGGERLFYPNAKP
ncbi:MAG: substrate-binding domain-containing protein [Pseudomonadota bacterium]